MKIFKGLAFVLVAAGQEAATSPEIVAPAPPPPPPPPVPVPNTPVYTPPATDTHTAPASQYKDRATARHLSEMHPDQHGDVHSEFRQAIQEQDDKALDELVKFGVKVHDQYHEEDGNAMHEAAMHGKSNAILALAKHGVNPDVFDRRGRTPMYWAAANGDMSVANALLKVGAKIMGGSDSDGQSALRRSIALRHVEMTELLLKNGADPHIRNRNGGCAIDAAHAQWDMYQDDRFYKLLAKYYPKDERIAAWITDRTSRDADLARRLGAGGAAAGAPPVVPPIAVSDTDL